MTGDRFGLTFIMSKQTPFLHGFPTLLFGSAKRSAQQILKQKSEELRNRCPSELSAQLADEITPEMVQRHSNPLRNRVYTQVVVFWSFLAQVLSEDSSCAKAVAMVQNWCRRVGLPLPSPNTGSYTKARQNLPKAMLDGIHGELCCALARNLTQEDLWRGHVIKAVDGSSVQLPDTAENQKDYPQPSTQQPGCGFPVMQIVALLNLCHGGWEQVVESKLDEHELSAIDKLIPYIGKDEILLADRAYGSYELIARLSVQDSHVIVRHHQARKLDFRRGKKLGPDERLVKWQRPTTQPKGSRLSSEEWNNLPEELELRIIRVRTKSRDGKRKTLYLVTTLLDPFKYPTPEVASLYFHRWEIELRFRDLKTTMGMERLRTKSPKMARKELMMFMIAYNAIRLLMLKAAKQEGVGHRRLSYKGALQVLDTSSADFVGTQTKPKVRGDLKSEMLSQIASRTPPDRPGRNEPREIKTRPKPFPRLGVPRGEHPHHYRSDEYPDRILDKAA